MIVNLVSEKDSAGRYVYDDLFLSNYATIQLKDELLRLPGVGDVEIDLEDFGQAGRCLAAFWSERSERLRDKVRFARPVATGVTSCAAAMSGGEGA